MVRMVLVCVLTVLVLVCPAVAAEQAPGGAQAVQAGQVEGAAPPAPVKKAAKHAAPKVTRGVQCMAKAKPGAPAPITASVSAYSPAETRGADGSPVSTATGAVPRRGIVAISRDLFDAGWTFGREICVSGHGIFVIDDLMGTGRTKGVDIFMDTRNQALRFGRRTLKVRLMPLPAAAEPAASEAPAAATPAAAAPASVDASPAAAPAATPAP